MRKGIRIGQKHSNDFSFDVYIENTYELIYQESRSELVEVSQKSGAFKRTNTKRNVVERELTFHLKQPNIVQLRGFKEWISQENVYLVLDQENDVRYFLYKTKSFSSYKSTEGNYKFEVTLIHDSIAEEIVENNFLLGETKTIHLGGNAICYPIIEFTANTNEKLTLSFGNQHLIFEQGLVGTFKMDSNPNKPFVSLNGVENAVEWRGDFLEFDPQMEKIIGVSTNPTIENIKVTVRWRWI